MNLQNIVATVNLGVALDLVLIFDLILPISISYVL